MKLSRYLLWLLLLTTQLYAQKEFEGEYALRIYGVSSQKLSIEPYISITDYDLEVAKHCAQLYSIDFVSVHLYGSKHNPKTQVINLDRMCASELLGKKTISFFSSGDTLAKIKKESLVLEEETKDEYFLYDVRRNKKGYFKKLSSGR